MGEVADQVASLEQRVVALERQNEDLRRELSKHQPTPEVGDLIECVETGSRAKVTRIDDRGFVWGNFGAPYEQFVRLGDLRVIEKATPLPGEGRDG